MSESVKGFKVFNPDWTCRGFQFEVGQTFKENVTPGICNRGFHFCKQLKDCFNYYKFNHDNKVAEVEAVGDIDTSSDDKKYSTNKLHIIREITWYEVLELVNVGKYCTGYCNSGYYNSGYYNSGNCNSGHHNSGYYNSGDYNSGNYNSGNWNSGYYNSGYRNSGNYNSGNRNSGDYNSGYYNSGNYNSGNRNSGDYNSGYRNSGNYNSGNRNSGDYNSGDYNSGNYNSGNWNSGYYNSGDWNKASNAVGCFNTENQKLKFFNKETDMTLEQWRNSKARHLLNQIDFRPTNWIRFDDMTDEEKVQFSEYKLTGGYLKKVDNKDCYLDWWNSLRIEQRCIIQDIPNFDKEVFFEITGIKVD